MTTEIVPSDETPPAHLAKLTSQQCAFVCNYVTNGGKGGKAARAAGFAESSADAYASRLLRNPLILHAIQMECVMLNMATVPMAMKATRRLALGAKSEFVRLQAAQDIQDRAGFSAPKQVQHSGGLSIRIDLSA